MHLGEVQGHGPLAFRFCLSLSLSLSRPAKDLIIITKGQNNQATDDVHKTIILTYLQFDKDACFYNFSMDFVSSLTLTTEQLLTFI